MPGSEHSPTVVRSLGIAGASQAAGTTIVIDTFRAFTTAAALLDRGVSRLVLCDDIDRAHAIARSLGAVLIGEDKGIRPDDFDHGNSPAEIMRTQDLTGRPAVLRTSAGTRCVLAAVDAGAQPVYAASLAVASPTASACAGAASVTIVSAGTHGVEPSVEDDITGDLIADLLHGRGDRGAAASAVRRSDRARQLVSAAWAEDGDVELACTVDRWSFAMRAVMSSDGNVELAIHQPPDGG